MEIHKPKLWHGWREFLKEYAIIFVGVLTALGAEQLVERIHWSFRMEEIRNQLRAELSYDVGDGIVWLTLAPCVDQAIDELKASISEARKTGVFSPPAMTYTPTLLQFHSDAWLNARSLQVADHLSPKEAQDLSEAYFFASQLPGDLVELHRQAGALTHLWGQLDHVTPAEADELSFRVGEASELQTRNHLSAILMVRAANKIGIKVPTTVEDASELRRRPQYETCMSKPKDVEAVLGRKDISYGETFELLHLSKPQF